VRLLRRRAVLGSLALLAAALALIALGLFPQEPVRRALEARLRQSLGPGSSVGRIHVVPGRLHATVEDLVLDTPMLRVEAPRARLDLGVGTLTGGALSIRSLEVDEPRILVRASAASTAGAASPLTRPLLVQRLAVRGGHLTLEHASLGGLVRIHGLDLQGSIGTGALDARFDGGAWERTPPVALGPARARLRISPLLALDLESFEAGTARSRIRAAGSLGRASSLSPDLRFEADLDVSELSEMAGRNVASGRLGVQGRLRSGAEGPELEAEATPKGVIAYGVPVGGGRVGVVHRAAETTLSPTLGLLGGTLSGEARLSGNRTRGDLRVVGLDAARLRAAFAPSAPAVAGSVEGRVTWSGSLEREVPLRVHLEGQGRAAPLASLHVRADAEGRLSLGDGRIQMDWSASFGGDGAPDSSLAALALAADGTLQGNGVLAYDGHASGAATLRLPAGPRDLALLARAKGEASGLTASATILGLGGEVTLDAEAEGSKVRKLAVRGTGLDLSSALPDTTGVARFLVESSGPLDRLALRGEGGVDGLGWRKAALGPLELELRGDSRSPELRLRAPALQATAEARLTERGALNAAIEISRSPLAPFSALSPTPLDGSVSATVEIGGPLGSPKAIRASARIESAEILALGLAVRAARPASIRYESGSLEIADLGLVGDGLRLSASGTLATAAGSESSLQASASVDLARLPLPKTWQLAGTVDADLVAAGTPQRPKLSGTVTLASVTVSGPSLPSMQVAEGRIGLEGEVMSIPGLVATLAEGRATLSGRVPLAAVLDTARRQAKHLEPDEEASLRVSWSGIDAGAILEPIRPGSSSLLSGALSGEAILEGGLRSLHELRGAVSAPKTALLVEDLAIDVGPIAVGLRDGVATIPEALVATQGGSLALRGNVNVEARRFEAAGTGKLDLRTLAPLLGDARLSGTADLDLSATGPFDAPSLRGTLSVADATLRVRDVPQAVTGIRGRVVFDERTVRIEEASAAIGGGPLALSGSASLGQSGLSDVDLVLTGKDMALRYPEGLRTRADAELRLQGRSGALRLAGSVRARSGWYDLEGVLRASLRGAPAAKPTPSPFLRSITLDVDVDVDTPIVVKSSLTDVRVGGRLSMLGDLETPEPFGQLALERGGKVYLQGRTFQVEKGSVTYEGAWDPSLDVEVSANIQDAATSQGENRITVTATGTLASPNLVFASSPQQLSETQIRSLIATGSLDASNRESSKALAGDQAAMFLAGGLTGSLGLDPVPIQPQLLSREQEPGAKFVFGKRLTRQVSLAYSLSLNDPEDRFIQLSAEPWRDVTGLVQVREDGTWAVGAGQRLEIGGPRRPQAERRRARPKLAEVRLEGDLPLPEAEIRKALGLRAGSRPTSWDLQESADKLRLRLVERGYLEAEVASLLDETAAVFRIQSGPRYRWRVEGMNAPPPLDGVIRSAFFPDEALDLGRQRLLREMRSRGHLRADVQARAEDEPAGRVLVFTVKPGRRYDSAEARFPGATAIGERRLLKAAGGTERLLAEERAALEAIRAEYAKIHHLTAEAGPVSVREEGNRLLIEVPVRDGPPALLSAVSVEDSTLPAEETAAALRLQTGAPYDESAIAEARQRLRNHYLGLGYPKVRVTPIASVVGCNVEVVYRVTEGPRLVVGSVEITGASRTRRSLILGKVELEPGDPLDLRKLVSSERKLRDLALFSRVATDYTDESPATVRLEVEEQAPLWGGYQLRYNEEDGPSGEIEAVARNLLGTGLTLGARYRRGADVDEERGSLDLPSFFRGRFTALAFRLYEELPGGTDPAGNPVTNRRTQRGFQVQQTLALENRWNLLAAYRFKRVSTVSPFLSEPIEDDIAALDLSLFRETRDNPLDSRRGRFWSFNVELSPKSLGSDLTFVKGFAQGFFSRSFGPSVTWAQGYRLGLATGFNGQNLVSSERFTAGGANSLRGFETDSVGPRDAFGDPAGGQAVVILNQELRLHHHTGLGAAVFYDGGNVFASVKDMSLDLRHVLGAGVRYVSPVGLLRLDLGFPLFRKPGEKTYQLFFSFGQAF
jgi:outer membrane protein assembly complex protein YaeT